MKEFNNLWTICKENGDKIAPASSVEIGKEMIQWYEQIDKNNNEYTPNFYGIAEFDESDKYILSEVI